MTIEAVIWTGPAFMAIIAMGIHLLANQHLTVKADINDAKIVGIADYFKSKRFVWFNQKIGIALFLIGLCAYLYANSGLCMEQEDFCRGITAQILVAVTFVLGTWMGILTTVQHLIKEASE